MLKVIRVTSKKITAILLIVIFFLLGADLLMIYLKFEKGYQHLKGFMHGFYFDTEANFPSLYSALAILFSAALLWLIGNLISEKKENRSIYWKLLSLVFIFLALDEFASIHEYLIQPMQHLVSQSAVKSDYLYFAWLVPYGLLCLILMVVLFKFFFKLPVRTRILFVIAGFIFLSGAVVMEMIGGKYWAGQGWSIEGNNEVDLNYALITTFEEFLEMLGIVVFIYALTTYYLKNENNFVLYVQVGDSKNNIPGSVDQ